MIDVGAEEIVLFGFSVALLRALRGQVPDRAVLVVEEPDVANARGADGLVREHPAVSRLVLGEYLDPRGLDRLLERTPAIGRARAVVPGCEYAVVPAAVVADRLGVPGAGSAAALAFRDKFALREQTVRAGIRNPGYSLVARVEDAERFFLDAGGRACVLKPTARQASAGVQFVTDLSQIRQGWRLSLEPDEGHRVPARGVPSRVLIEHALHGPEYSVEQLVVEGQSVFRNVTAKQVQPGRFPVEVGHTTPADVPPALRQALTDATERLVRATGFRTGILHSEWIAQDDGPALVECAARMPGDEIGALISDAWGFDLAATYLQVLLGVRVQPPQAAVAGAAIAFLTVPPGEVVAVEGVEQARTAPGVRDVSLRLGVGAIVPSMTSSWDRIGYVRVVAESPAQAQRAAAELASAITVTVRPLAPPHIP